MNFFESLVSFFFLMCMLLGEKSRFQVRVTPTPNYPLDLYFLMDLSSSMQPLVDQLFNLSLEIGEDIDNNK